MIEQEEKHHHILNSKTEFSRCNLPRVSTRLGDQDFRKDKGDWAAQVKRMKDQESTLEAKIIKIRKERNRARLLPPKEAPAKKRRKTGEEEYISIREIWTNGKEKRVIE